MNRRNFLKGFLAATGTLAVAPTLVLEPVANYSKSELWPMIEEIIESQMSINRAMLRMDHLMSGISVVKVGPESVKWLNMDEIMELDTSILKEL